MQVVFIDPGGLCIHGTYPDAVSKFIVLMFPDACLINIKLMKKWYQAWIDINKDLI